MRIPTETCNIHTAGTRVSPQDIKEITSKFSSIFEGTGKIMDNKSNKELYAKFSMRPDAVPVAQRPRPVPYYLQKRLKLWLDQCVENSIFERVLNDEPITWCSPVVAQPLTRVHSHG